MMDVVIVIIIIIDFVNTQLKVLYFLILVSKIYCQNLSILVCNSMCCLFIEK